MKILYIITLSDFGGAQAVVYNLANDQVKRGNEVMVVSGNGNYEWTNLDEHVKLLKLDYLHREIGVKDFLVLMKFIRLRYSFCPDIVHLHSSKMGVLGRIAFSKRNVVYTVHGFDSVRMANRKFLFLERLLKNRAASIVGVCRYDYNALLEEGIKKNVTYIYNGVPDMCSCPFEGEEEKETLREIEDIKKRYSKVVMCIARDAKQKKIDLFFDLAKACQNYAFVWIGNLNQYENVPENAFLLGSKVNAYKYWKLADLCVFPSNYEGLPISIIEALSYSVPVVASNVGGVAEILDGTNGYAIENDVTLYAEKIKFALDEENWSRLSKAARRSYENHFTIDKMVNSYNDIYKKMF